MKIRLIDKLNILLWLNSLGGKNMKLFEKVDGLKSTAGLLAIVAYYALPQFGIKAPEAVLTVGSGLAGIGFAHKLEKATGLLSKGLDIAIKVLEVAKQVLAALKAKEEKLEEKK